MMRRHALSDEQEAIVRCPDRTVLVSAGAGTGKTSTLEEYAKARPELSFLYLAFNQAIRSEGQRRFPRNVRCLTTHGLAFPHFGRQFEHKLGNPKPYHLVGTFDVPLVTAGLALAGILRWLSSADDDVEAEHFPDADTLDRGRLVDLARKTWRVMCDPAATAIPMPHDGYLKLYQLSRPALDVDVVLFDEAQDANAAVLDVINRQEQCVRVFVGDRRQAIYGFRGAVNAMDMVSAGTRLHLTGSFRYGQGVADIANAVLSAHAQNHIALRGLAPLRTRFTVSIDGPHTVLARTNSGLFSAAVDVLDRGQPLSFIGGAGSYRFNTLLDAGHLRRGRFSDIRDPFLRAFDSYSQMREYAESVEDGELWSVMSVVDRFGDDLPGLISALTRESPANGRPAVALATAHRAKGLEWPAVILHEDFTDMRSSPVEGGDPMPPDSEEINLLYVAVTRAKQAIALHAPLLSWIEEQKPSLHEAITQGFHHPVLPPRQVSGLDFGGPTLAAPEILSPACANILRDTPAMIAGLVEKCDPKAHHLLKLVFDLTHHLATGRLVLQKPGAAVPRPETRGAPVAASALTAKAKRAVPKVALPDIEPRVVVPLWMAGKTVESISEQLATPLDAVVAVLAKTLLMDACEVLLQSERRGAEQI